MKPGKDILNELKEISPMLLEMKLKGGNPFRVPEGYFADLKTDVFRTIDTGLADDLGRQVFKVPENYFENLTSDIMDRLEAEELAETDRGGRLIDLNAHRKRRRFPVFRMTAMAASVAIFLLLGVFAARFFLQDTIGDPEMAITQEEAYEYIESNFAEFESEDLLALVDLSTEDFSLDMTDELEDELEQYLEENIDDLDEYLLTIEI
jgi:hypothetical protein